MTLTSTLAEDRKSVRKRIQKLDAVTSTLLVIGAIDFLLHMYVAGNYGYFRDELYYIVSGQHLQAGYVDFPPMIAYLAALMNVIAGDNLVAIHVVPALAGAALVVVAGLIARELGGNRWAQVLAAVSTFATAQLGFAAIFSMDILDALWWSLSLYIVVRIIKRDEPRLWLAFGLVAGLGLFTKLTIVFLLFSMLVGLIATPARKHLKTRWFWMGAVFALAFLVPYILWNAVNGWPTVDFYIHHGGLNGSGPAAFIVLQILVMSPVNIPVVIAGLYFLLRSPFGKMYRSIGIALTFLFVLFVIIDAKPYFYEAAYPALVAAGAVALSQKGGQMRSWLPKGFIVALIVAGALFVPLEMPLLPPSVYVGSYSALTGVANGAAAQGNAGQFPQYLGDRFGWDTMTQTVSQVYHSLPPQEQSEACIFASNYGEASAITFLGKGDGLPPVISAHNNYYVWGPGNCGQVLVTVGVNITELQQAYADVTQAGTITCNYCMTYEDNLPVYVATNPTVSLASVWSSIKDFS